MALALLFSASTTGGQRPLLRTQPPRGCFAARLLLLPVRLSSKAASARTAIGLLQQRMAEQLAAVEVGLRCRTTQGGIFTQQRKCTKGQEATSSSTSLSSSEGETPTDSSRGTTTTTLLPV